ncbi:MAG: endonuclease/exonuclease/phosphatase family protein [Actinomycetota bacterium]
MPLDEVLASENEVRTGSMEILTPDLEELVEQGYPVFLTGDFNTPSSLDYTEETVGTRKGITQPVPWPVSELLTDVGMRDTYREIHPDPVEVPGLTKDNPDFREGGFGDRIDYVYAGGPGTTVDSQLVGEPRGPDVDIEFDPWTSDHRAILSTFEVTPVALRTTVSLDRRMLTQGDELNVRYNAPGHEETSVALVPEGGDASAAIENATTGESGETSFDTGELDPEGYDIVMFDGEGSEIARNSFWVRSVESDVAIEAGKDTYEVGEPIDISWDDGPANRWDWIGVYRASASDPKEDDYLLWGYVGGHESGALPPQVFGGMTLSGQSQGRPWPLPPGAYRIHYLLTDQYRSAGYADVSVTG